MTHAQVLILADVPVGVVVTRATDVFGLIEAEVLDQRGDMTKLKDDLGKECLWSKTTWVIVDPPIVPGAGEEET